MSASAQAQRTFNAPTNFILTCKTHRGSIPPPAPAPGSPHPGAAGAPVAKCRNVRCCFFMYRTLRQCGSAGVARAASACDGRDWRWRAELACGQAASGEQLARAVTREAGWWLQPAQAAHAGCAGRQANSSSAGGQRARRLRRQAGKLLSVGRRAASTPLPAAASPRAAINTPPRLAGCAIEAPLRRQRAAARKRRRGSTSENDPDGPRVVAAFQKTIRKGPCSPSGTPKTLRSGACGGLYPKNFRACGGLRCRGRLRRFTTASLVRGGYRRAFGKTLLRKASPNFGIRNFSFFTRAPLSLLPPRHGALP
jgi:hypothetical protein